VSSIGAREFERIASGAKDRRRLISMHPRSPLFVGGGEMRREVAVFSRLARLARSFVFSKAAQSDSLPAVILGEAADARGLYRALEEAGRATLPQRHALRIAAVFADGARDWPEDACGDLVVGETRWAASFSECCGIRRGIVAVPAECTSETEELVEKAAAIFPYLFVAPQITKDEVTAVAVMAKDSRLEIHVGNCAAPSAANLLKRIGDIAGALALGILTLPFLLSVAIAIWITSRGPIFYKQLRIGKGNRLFFALKFRTMFVDAGERLEHHLEKDPALRTQWESVHKLKNDPRVTSIGRLLRRFSLDELPQIWNVLVGDMSLVGPRPIVVAEIAKYGLDYAAYEAVRPGLTGLWQVSGRNDTTYRQRVDYDSYYVRNWSLGLDARIVAKTFRAVISGVGAY